MTTTLKNKLKQKKRDKVNRNEKYQQPKSVWK